MSQTPERLIAEGVIRPPGTTGFYAAPFQGAQFVFLPVTIHGRRMTLLLDTGAYGSLFSAVARASADVGVPNEAVHDDSAGHPRLDSLAIGTAVEYNIPVSPGGWTSFIDPPPGLPPMAGMLGNDVLAHYDMEVDGPARRVRLYAPTRPPGGARGVATYQTWLPRSVTPGDCVSMRNEGNWSDVVIPMGVNGHILSGLFDSGSWPTYLDTASFHASGGDLMGQSVRPAPADSTPAYMNQRAEWEATNAVLTLGTQRLSAVPLFLLAQIPAGGGRFNMGLGLGAVRDRVLFISYSGRQVCLGRRRGSRP